MVTQVRLSQLSISRDNVRRTNPLGGSKERFKIDSSARSQFLKMGQPTLAILEQRRLRFESNAFVKVWQVLVLMRNLFSA